VNVQEYIESGSIESCVLGLADQAEQQELERMCAAYPEVRAARDAFEASLEASAMAGAVAPPPALRDSIFEKITQPESGSLTQPAPVVELPTPEAYSGAGWKKYLVAASVILLAGSAVLNIYLYNRYQQSDSLYKDLLAQQQQLAENNNSIQTRLNELETDLSRIKNPNVQPIKMTAVNNTNSLTTVYWDKNAAEVYLLVNQLPKPEPGKQYQLWAIVNGKPVDAGVIDLEPGDGLVKMKNIPSAEAFAITLENAGGSQSPTLTAMYVLGKV
jgi:anti-sigma-K factor RskA